jgi:antitoxin PrlF
VGRITTITSKGQVTIPKAVRDALGLKPADRVEFVVEDGTARLRKHGLSIRDLVGILPPLGIPIEDMPRIAKEERAKRWLKKP